MQKTYRQALAFSFFLCLLLFFSGTSTALPMFENDPVLHSDTGYVALSWGKQEGAEIELQQAHDSAFSDATTIYQGQNNTLFVSGLKDGTYYYRLRAKGGEWGEGITLHVVHHPMHKAWLLFALGAFVFLSIVFVIVKGSRAHES